MTNPDTQTSATPASTFTLAFTVPQPELLAAVKFAAKAVPSRPAVPVLAGLVLTSDGTTVTVEAFDYEQARRVVLPGATGVQAGSVLVSAAKLAEMVGVLPKDRPITLDCEGAKVRLTNGKTTYRVQTMPVEDYPSRPAMPATVGMIDAALLAAKVTQAAKFAGKDETLPMMTGVHITAAGDRLSVEATDRYRLAVRDLPWANAVDKLAALLPAKVFAEVTKALAAASPGAVVTLGFDQADAGGGLFGMEVDGMQVCMRTIDCANYPPIRSLLPKAFAREVELDAAALSAAVKRAAVALERTMPVLLTLAGDTLTLEGGSDDGDTASEPFEGATFLPVDEAARAAAIKAAVKEARKKATRDYAKLPQEEREAKVQEAGEAAEKPFTADQSYMCVGTNPAYLIELLGAAGTKRVRLRFVDAFKPFLIAPLDGDGALVPDVWNLLMPIRVTRGESTPSATPKAAPTAKAAKAAKAAKPVQQQPAAPANGYDGDDRCTVCGEHIADPHAPGFPCADPADTVQPTPSPEPVAEPVTTGAVVVYDRTVVHPFQRAVEDGKKTNPFTKCMCGTTRNAKVHRVPGAAAVVAAKAEPTVPAGKVWFTAMQLAGRVNGQLVTEATEAGAQAVVAQFTGKHGADTVLAVHVSTQPDGTKHMFVAARSQRDAELLRLMALGGGIAGYTAEGEWPPQGAAAGTTQEDTQVKAHEESPVITGHKPPFDANRCAKEAFIKFTSGDFDGALALVEHGMSVTPDHRFTDAERNTYGWARIRDGILAKQVEAEIAAEAQQATQTVVAEPVAEVAEPAEVVEPAETVEPADAEPVAETVEDDPMVERLRAALAGLPADVVEAAVKAAKDSVTAAPPAKQATPAPKPVVKQAPAKKAPVPTVTANTAPQQQPAAPATADVAAWKQFGMLPPVTTVGERVFLLPAGTRLRALRAAVLADLAAAKADGRIAQVPNVDVDKTQRPYRLRVRADEPGVLSAASQVLNDAVLAAMPDVAPARATA
jgi:DNA polymerase III beta subunit